MVSIYSKEYLSSQNNNNIARLLVVDQHIELLGMLGSMIACIGRWSHLTSKPDLSYIPSGL